MNTAPRLDAPWLGEERVRRIFALLNDEGEEGRAVGGAVRDALLGRPVTDIDFATTGRPEWVTARAAALGIKAIPTGIEHGTVTLVVAGRGHEVTTLREDVETDGRHAVVRFGRDWAADARRRDFTINALSVEADGTLHDPVLGYPDIVARRVRFIGDPDRRIAEDYLRILRFFRFHAQCGAGPLDAAGRDAAVRGRGGLRGLAAERINHELRRLLLAPRAAETVAEMQDAGILPLILAGIGYVVRFARLIAFEDETALEPAYPRRLAALAVRISEDAERLASRLRLANVDRDAIMGALNAAVGWASPPPTPVTKEAAYRRGRPAVVDGLALAAAESSMPLDGWVKALKSLGSWEPPAFPLAGKDLLALGVLRGPGLGKLLKELEEWWIGENFAPERAGLLARLQQIYASQQ